jgi:hypothetical protein
MAVGMVLSTQVPPEMIRKSFPMTIHKRNPSGTSLFALTSRLKSQTIYNTTHTYYTKTQIFPFFTSNAADAAGAGVLNVLAVQNIIAGMTFINFRTKEQIIINSVAANGLTLTVTRQVGTVAAAATAVNDVWYQSGNAFEEGSLRPNPITAVAVGMTTFTQIFRNTWALTDTARAMATAVIEADKANTNNIVSSTKMEAANFHALDIERAEIWGQKFNGIRNANPFRTLEGVVAATSDPTYYPASYGGTTNVYTAGATTSFTQLAAMLEPSLDYQSDGIVSNDRVILAGSKAISVINQIGRAQGTFQMTETTSSFGLRFKTFNTDRGTFSMIEHPLLNSNANWAKMAISVDPNALEIAYLGDRKTYHLSFNVPGETGQDAEDNGIDAIGGTFTTELTLLHNSPPSNAVIYNLTAGVAG